MSNIESSLPSAPVNACSRWFHRLLALIALVAAGFACYAGREGYWWFLLATGYLLLRSDGIAPERIMKLAKSWQVKSSNNDEAQQK
jgi:hypothetical protein